MAYYGRGKNKIQNPYTLPDMYNDYKNKVEKNSPYDISYSLYKDIVSLYNKKVSNKLLEGFNINFPYKLGSLQIIKKIMYFNTQKNKRLGIDWKNTIKHGKLIHHLNEHSDGYKFLFFWDRRSVPCVRRARKYKLIPTRTLKRTMAKLIIEEKKDYFEI